MRVLVIAPQPFFTARGTPFSVYYRTQVMAQLGARIDLLTYGQGRDVDLPGVRIVRIPRFAFLGPVPIGPSMLKLFLDGFIVLWTLAMLVRHRYDVVHAHEESVFFTRFLKPIFRFRLIYDMHSSLPQQLTNFEFTSSKLLIGLFDTLERSCLRAADAVITICPELARHALDVVPDASRHLLIENSIFDPVRLVDDGSADAAPEPDVEQLERALPLDRPLVTYAGTFEAYQGLETLVRAFAAVRRERPDAHLLMIGGRPDQVEALRAVAASADLGEADVTFTGRLPQAATHRLMRHATVLTSPRSEGTNTPLKIYEQLASGRPLVATRILSHTQVLDESVCFLCEPRPDAMAAAILGALDPEQAPARASAARALYEREYSRASYERKMRRLLELVG